MPEQDYWEMPPPLSLARYIEACWVYCPKGDKPRADVLLAEGVVDLVFNFGEPYHRRPANSTSADGEWIAGNVVVGQRTHLFVVTWPADTRLFAVRLKTSAASLFFPAGLTPVTDKAQPLASTIFSGLSRSMSARTFGNSDELATCIYDFFDQLSHDLGRQDGLLLAALDLIERQQGDVDVQSLCEELGVNRKRLERTFAHHVGLTPKFYVRTVRLHHFLVRHQGGSASRLVTSALDAHYYDQSHFIKEFRKFTGESPSAFFNSPPDIYAPLIKSLLRRYGQSGASSFMPIDT